MAAPPHPHRQTAAKGRPARDTDAGVRGPTTCLSGGLIGPGDGLRLPHTSDAFGARHQDRRLARLEGAACSNSQRDCRHTLVIRHIADEDDIILAEAIPTAHEFTADGLARLTTDGFNSVLRLLELGGPRLRGGGCLVHIERHDRPPSLLCIPSAGIPDRSPGVHGNGQRAFFADEQFNSAARFAQEVSWSRRYPAYIFDITDSKIILRHDSPDHRCSTLTRWRAPCV